VILTKDHLNKIIKEELERFSEAEAAADQGGDKGAAPTGEEPSKDVGVEKVENKLEQYLTPLMGKINTPDKLRDTLTIFLNMATQNPSLGAGKVNLVLVNLAKQVVAAAKQAKK